MGLLDDLLYNASPDNGPGLFGYLNSGRTAHVSDEAKDTPSPDDLAKALGIDSIAAAAQQAAAQNPPAAAPSGLIPMVPAAGAPGAPSVPISTSNFTPPAAPVAPPAATAPAFGAGGSPFLFPQSAALFGNNLPPATPPAAPATAQKPPVVAADDDEEEAPAAPAANAPASPIPVGNVNMPRIGPAAAFNPRVMNASAAAPTPAAPAATPDVGDHLKAAWQSMRHGGGLIGGLSALVTGQRDDPENDILSRQAHAANVTGQALVKLGVDPSVAAAATAPGNGDLLKAVFAQALTPKAPTNLGNGYILPQGATKAIRAFEPDDKFQHVTVKNPDGSESLMTFDPSTGKYTGSPSAASLKSAIDPNLTGKERMDAIMAADPNYGRKIQAMVNGDLPLPTSGQAARSPQAQKMVEDVLAVDGATSASDFATRAATRKDYASGIASRVTKSLNTTIKHAGQLDADVDKLGNYTYFPGVANYVHDKYASNTDPEYQKARSKFEEDKEAFVKELDFTLSGGHSSVSGSAQLRDKISRADSPEAMHAAIQSALHLLSARLDSHTRGFNEGTKSQRDGQDFLYPENKAIYNKLLGSADTSTGQPVPGVSASATPAAAAAPATPKLKVGESTTINGVPIKKVAD